jgi:phosphopantothenoylcysteine decarboxylase/phosphopantothenate--cysteine ligase
MWAHPSVQANLKTLIGRGARIIEPEIGQMACKTYGKGRLAPVEVIVDYVSSLLQRSRDLTSRKILVTAGPTVEDIDPVRFVSNRSSGKMGLALARAARDRGAEVTLVAGPTDFDFPGLIRVRSTEEMRKAVFDHAAAVDVVIKAAAPLDFRPKSVASQKIKKRSGELAVDFEPTPDILQELGRSKNGKVLVGFAAETENHLKNGLDKLKAKNLDLIVINPVSGPDSAFDSDTNRATIIDASGKTEDLPAMSKVELADRILDRVVRLLSGLSTSSPSNLKNAGG